MPVHALSQWMIVEESEQIVVVSMHEACGAIS